MSPAHNRATPRSFKGRMATLIGHDKLRVESPRARYLSKCRDDLWKLVAHGATCTRQQFDVSAATARECAKSVELHFEQPFPGREWRGMKRRMHQIEMPDSFRDDDVARH